MLEIVDQMNKQEERGEIEVATWAPAFEVLMEILFRVLGLCIVYLIFDYVGNQITGPNDFDSGVLLSLVVLPAIYVLKDISQIPQPFFVRVNLNSTKVIVRSGILTIRDDSLDLNNVENIETITPFLGRFCNYASLDIYVYGSNITLPNIRNASEVKKKINKSTNR